MKALHIKPKHWWEYLSIRFWIRKRDLEKIINYYWEKEGMDKKILKWWLGE